MSLFGPESMWASPRPSLRLLLPALLAAIAFAFALTPVAGAQEADPANAGEPTAVVPESPSDLPVVPEAPPIPEPQPAPEPSPAPEPAASAPEPSPAPEPAASAGEPPQQPGDRDTVAHAGPPSHEPATTTFTPAAPTPAATIESSDSAGPTTAPLGWDVYDDVLLAETFNDDGGAGSFGTGAQAVFRGLGALGTIASPVERDRRSDDANPPSRAEPMSAGGSGPGGSGPGQGPSLGLFGAAGGSGAGMALLTLLGMACGWLLLAPLPKRAFLTSTAMWRPSAYVPPIDRPG